MRNPDNLAETSRYCKEISKLTGLPEDAVRSVFDSLELLLLFKIYEKVSTNPDPGHIQLEIPLIGKLTLMPIPYNDRESTLRAKIELSYNFRERSIDAYYNEKNYLVDHVKEKFTEIILDKYKSLI